MADQPGIIRFGVFDVNLTTGELRKNGSRVKLQEQPFQVLVVLLKRPGEIVTKEELKERLWAGDTFVDFDHSLSTAVNKIREALGDSTSSPRFVQTVPKRGYRFVGVLEPRAGTAIRPDRSRVIVLVGVGLAAGLAVAVAAIYHLQSHRASTQPAFIETPLTVLPGSEQTPSFSMDGTMVAFSCQGEQPLSSNICLQVVGGSSGLPRRLTRGPARDLQPAWSPDGTSIAFVRVLTSNPPPHGGRYVLMEVSPLAGQERTIIETSSRNDNLRPVVA